MIVTEGLTPDELAEIEQMSQVSSVGVKIRSAGFPCKDVFRFWSAGESDLDLEGERCEVAIYLDAMDRPRTARLRGEAVVVDDGW